MAMTRPGHNERLRTPTIGLIFANVADVRCFLHSETKHRATYDRSVRDTFGLFLGVYSLQVSGEDMERSPVLQRRSTQQILGIPCRFSDDLYRRKL